ncbi:MAG TPA: TrmB family transcriptional regulator sugar-binding domain-containing protein [Candidatus Thermoplasmatota archaeon]|nr:TrmB family transcriptional regulator sugar-binding domain-containing protein [Candidatus Thermoplasmatota archaeon]
MHGKTFSLNEREVGFALDHIHDLLVHERRDIGVPARIRGISTHTGSRVEIEGDIVSVIKLQGPGKFLRALVLETPSGLYTVGADRAVKEDVAAETLTLLI